MILINIIIIYYILIIIIIRFVVVFHLASPSPPTDFTVREITSKSVTLHWGTPEKNGGSEITGKDYEQKTTENKI